MVDAAVPEPTDIAPDTVAVVNVAAAGVIFPITVPSMVPPVIAAWVADVAENVMNTCALPLSVRADVPPMDEAMTVRVSVSGDPAV